jgi:glutaredoxin
MAMNPRTRPFRLRFTQTCSRLAWTAGLALLASTSAQAQFKIVEPDGSVGYSDRPPVGGAAKVIALSRATSASAAAAPLLPPELRTAVLRYPVTLFVTADCAPCDAGRRFLQQRGVPFTERNVVSEDDAAALERAIGGRTVPALAIGTQPVRGWAEAEWSAYLDVAGYPREARAPLAVAAGSAASSGPTTSLYRPAIPASAPTSPNGTVRLRP